jgi:hypothetical protein
MADGRTVVTDGTQDGQVVCKKKAPPPKIDDFAGTWECSGTSTFDIPGSPAAPTAKPTEVLAIRVDGPQALVLSRTKESRGAPCDLHLTVAGNDATFVPGQTCSEAPADAGAGGATPPPDAGQAFGGMNLTAEYEGGITLNADGTLSLIHAGPLTFTGDGGTQTGTHSTIDNCKKRPAT